MSQTNIRIMVVEDEPEVREEYRLLIERRNMLQLVAETDRQEDALKLLESIPIDALILDLELPQGSGILLLEKLEMMPVEKPFIAVVTNVVSKVVYDTIRRMGVDYICTKGNADFSLEVPLSIIEISAPYRQRRESAGSMSRKLNTHTRRDLYRRSVERELFRMGFPAKMLGTRYCQEGILYFAMSEKTEISMTKDLYPYIASKHQTNIKNVEKDIRIAIEKVWTEQDIRDLREMYPCEWNEKSGRPTNAEFIHNMVQKIIRQ